MNILRIFIAVLILLFVGVSLQPGEFFIPVEVPEYKILSDFLQRDEFENISTRFNSQLAPISEKNLFPDNMIFGKTKPDRFQLSPFLIISEDFRSSKFSRASGFESIRVGFLALAQKNISVYTSYLLDERLAQDPEYKGKKWRGLAGEVESAMAVYKGRGFQIIAGRFGSSWGPSRQSLILSETARPMDGIQIRGDWGKFKFTYQFAKLNRQFSFIENQVGYENRYFAGHRIAFKPNKNLHFSLFETIIYGGPGRSIELAYLNPLMFFHAFQLNENYDDNTFLGFDFTWFLKNRHKFYGQFLIDDFQIDSEVRGDNEPNEIGIQLGIHSIDLFNLFDLKAEYLKITNRTYNQIYARNRYENRGELIGHPFGPDGERYSLTFEKWFRDNKKASLNFSYQRKGEGRFDDYWDEPWLDTDDYSEPFPTGIVEKSFLISTAFSGYIKPYLYIDALSGINIIDNYAHIDGLSKTIPFLSIRLSLLLSTRLNVQN
ncbi:MAG: capsule assembly Wzi family protein [candidate division Zixibacteria bacterium]|nr:capsule assembly Wzi family protein [candidate division Zixibacteria bacterium]